MKHAPSSSDRHFRAAFEACRLAAPQFDHRAHIRLAYTYLAEHDDETALALIRAALRTFLQHHGADPSKYHETMTRAWMLAVRHFMARSPASPSAEAFIEAHPILLDKDIMMTHYSADLLFSEKARARFVEPDLDRIPRHGLPPA